MPTSVILRKERRRDVSAIHELTARAFLNVPHSSQTEPLIVDVLRASSALTLSLVAQKSDGLVGHVAVSPVSITDGAQHWYGLGPISVEPREQGQGVGTLLMQEALSELRSMGAHGCVLLGDPDYYSRFGFKPVAELVLPDVPPAYFQALLFSGEWPNGIVSYHSAFSTKS